MKTRTPWTDAEIDAVIALYFHMVRCVAAGRHYIKAVMIRNAQSKGLNGGPPCKYFGKLQHRSRGSVELKLMNITAAIHDLERDDLSMAEHGYRPLPNYQQALKTSLSQYLETPQP